MKTILLVENDETWINALKLVFQDQPYTLRCVSNSTEAITLLESNETFDAIITNLNLKEDSIPDALGYGILQKARTVRPDIPLLAISSFGPKKKKYHKDPAKRVDKLYFKFGVDKVIFKEKTDDFGIHLRETLERLFEPGGRIMEAKRRFKGEIETLKEQNRLAKHGFMDEIETLKEQNRLAKHRFMDEIRLLKEQVRLNQKEREFFWFENDSTNRNQEEYLELVAKLSLCLNNLIENMNEYGIPNLIEIIDLLSKTKECCLRINNKRTIESLQENERVKTHMNTITSNITHLNDLRF